MNENAQGFRFVLHKKEIGEREEGLKATDLVLKWIWLV